MVLLPDAAAAVAASRPGAAAAVVAAAGPAVATAAVAAAAAAAAAADAAPADQVASAEDPAENRGRCLEKTILQANFFCVATLKRTSVRTPHRRGNLSVRLWDLTLLRVVNFQTRKWSM